MELILSQEGGPLRVYAGGEKFFRREPSDLAERLVHAGAELRPTVFGDARLLLAADYKLVEEDAEWNDAWRAVAGVEIARVPSPGHPPRIISVVFEMYDGVAPYGQFYREDIRYLGVGINLSR